MTRSQETEWAQPTPGELAQQVRNAVFLDLVPCVSRNNRSIGGAFRLHYQGEKINELRSTLAVTSNSGTLFVSEERIAFVIRVKRISDIVTSLAVASN
jgi:hypothetical protein